MEILYRKVKDVEPRTNGYISLLLECRHKVSLEPTKGESSEAKAVRFQDYIGKRTPCEVCSQMVKPLERLN